MLYEVYIDSLFLMNLVLNLLMLHLVSRMIQCTATHWSLFLGAALGAAGECLFIVLPIFPIWLKLLLAYGGVGLAMVRIGLRITEASIWKKSLLLLYIFSFLFGGIMEFMGNQFSYFGKHPVTIPWILAGAYVSFSLLNYGIRRYLLGKKEKSIYPVHIYQNGGELALMALLDTGNSLVEPVSGKPVSIVEKEAILKLMQTVEPCRYHTIPYHSIGKAHGTLTGVRIDKMIIGREEAPIIWEQAILGIYEGSVSSENAYQMILHPKLLE